MFSQKTLVFIGAHPDDETFGHGGTLAQYADDGVIVYYICATRGESGTVDPQFMKGYASIGDLRWVELKCAAQTLGLKDIFYLGYRDSGMPGSEDNLHPQALMNADLDEVTERIVTLLRLIQPQVIITFDPIGGYYHPDHIAIHKAAVKAFAAASDPYQFSDAGPAYKPCKLYYGAFPHGFLKLAIKIMPLFGKNPHKLGRNQDMDLTQMVNVEYPIHAAIRIRKAALQIREKASNCHASQLAGGTPERGILGLIFKISALADVIFGQRDYYMRAYPPPVSKRKEKDLFEGL